MASGSHFIFFYDFIVISFYLVHTYFILMSRFFIYYDSFSSWNLLYFIYSFIVFPRKEERELNEIWLVTKTSFLASLNLNVIITRKTIGVL